MAEQTFAKRFLACFAAILFLFLALRIAVGPEFLTGTLLACFLFQLWRKPPVVEVAAVVTLGIVLTFVRLWIGAAIPPSVSRWLCFLSMLGVASLLVQGVLLPFSREDFKRRSTAFSSGLACLLFLMFSTGPLLYAAAHTPMTFDLYLLQIDRELGGDISFWVGRVVQGSKWLLYPVAFAYGGLALDAGVAVGAQMFKADCRRLNALLVLGAAGVAGMVLYLIVPATGPRFVFVDFPHPIAGEVAQQMVAVSASEMRNAMPSLHFSWTLLLFWIARDAKKWVRCVAGVFVILTFVATMALGQHYFIDLVVALPFTMTFVAISERCWGIAASSAALLFAWLLLLRWNPLFFVWMGRFTWLTVFLTVFAVLLLLGRVLQVAAVGPASPGAQGAPAI